MNKLSTAQNTKLDSFKHRSTKIRFLLSLKWTRSEIRDKLGCLYQHVRNVEVTPVKNPIEKF